MVVEDGETVQEPVEMGVSGDEREGRRGGFYGCGVGVGVGAAAWERGERGLTICMRGRGVRRCGHSGGSLRGDGEGGEGGGAVPRRARRCGFPCVVRHNIHRRRVGDDGARAPDDAAKASGVMVDGWKRTASARNGTRRRISAWTLESPGASAYTDRRQRQLPPRQGQRPAPP